MRSIALRSRDCSTCRPGLSDGTNQGTASRSNLVNLFGNAVVSDGPAGFVILHDGFGDANLFRDQGQMLIHSNTITNSADFGIVADAGLRDIDSRDAVLSSQTPRLGQSHGGPARNLLELNNATGTGAAGGMTPGATIVNNTISGEGLGGIHFSGDLRPYELIPRDNAGGDLVCDGDVFAVTVGRTTVQFEFEDLSDHAASRRLPGQPHARRRLDGGKGAHLLCDGQRRGRLSNQHAGRVGQRDPERHHAEHPGDQRHHAGRRSQRGVCP